MEPIEFIIYPTFGQIFYSLGVKKKTDYEKIPPYVIPESINVPVGTDFNMNFKEYIVVTKGEKTWYGTPIEITESSITLNGTIDKITFAVWKIMNPDYYVYQDPMRHIYFSKPSVISFLTTNTSCRSLYSLDVDNSTLQHNLDIKLPDTISCPMRVVFGDIRQASVSRGPEAVRLTAEKDTSGPEYTVYDLSLGQILASNLITNFRSWKGIDARKVYINDVTNNNVHHQYTFKATDYMPSGVVKIYKHNMLMGETMMSEVRNGRLIKLTLGTTSKVVVENNVFRDAFEEKDGEEAKVSGEEIEINIKLTNLTEEKKITVIFVFFVGEKVVEHLDEKHERSEGYLYFEYMISKETFTKKISFSINN